MREMTPEPKILPKQMVTLLPSFFLIPKFGSYGFISYFFFTISFLAFTFKNSKPDPLYEIPPPCFHTSSKKDVIFFFKGNDTDLANQIYID